MPNVSFTRVAGEKEGAMEWGMGDRGEQKLGRGKMLSNHHWIPTDILLDKLVHLIFLKSPQCPLRLLLSSLFYRLES